MNSATDCTPAEPVDPALLFAPAGELVPVALSILEQGRTLIVACIHLTDIPPLRYAQHPSRGRSVCSVTANTRRDGAGFLLVVSRIGARIETMPCAFDNADVALRDLAADRARGVAVLRIG